MTIYVPRASTRQAGGTGLLIPEVQVHLRQSDVVLVERLKRTKSLGTDPARFDEELTLFEVRRASINSYFCNNVGKNEDRDVAQFERKHREYEKENLDEVALWGFLHRR